MVRRYWWKYWPRRRFKEHIRKNGDRESEDTTEITQSRIQKRNLCMSRNKKALVIRQSICQCKREIKTTQIGQRRVEATGLRYAISSQVFVVRHYFQYVIPILTVTSSRKNIWMKIQQVRRRWLLCFTLHRTVECGLKCWIWATTYNHSFYSCFDWIFFCGSLIENW